ncbi:MAG: DUF3830 family protein [Acidimicrobiia bacterium]
MTNLNIAVGPFAFEGVFESEHAPETCAWFLAQLPFRSRVIHVRWSGEAVWIPLGDLKTGVAFENHTVHPSRGDILFYPGGKSEAEILFAYGSSSFASKMGDLAGNHFITIVKGREKLAEFGELVLWQGAQDIEFSALGD